MMAWWLLPLVIVTWLALRHPWWRPAVPPTHPRILMYHMISPRRRGARFNGLRVSPRRFERQLRYLQRQGWHFMTLGELTACYLGGESPPPRTVVLTFDDGYADNYHQALPLMRRYNAKGTLYLVVDRHGRDWSVQRKAHHNTGELAAEPKLTDDQVRKMLDSGLFELGGHGITHPNLPRLTPAERDREISESRRLLEVRFETPVTSFAYPFGLYTSEEPQRVETAGYTSAVTTREGIDTDFMARRFELSRVKVSGKDGMLVFRLKLRLGRRSW